MDNNNLFIKENIMNTARDIFLKKGYKGTKITDISSQLKISPSTFYKYFKGKKELFDILNIPEAKNLNPNFDRERKKILKEALLLFGENGYDGTSMDMIALKIGATKTKIYQHFKDKHELFMTVLKEIPVHFNFNIKKYNKTEEKSLNKIIWDIAKSYLNLFDTPERIAFTRAVFRDSIKYQDISSRYHDYSIGYVAEYLSNILNDFKSLLRENLEIELAAKSFIGSLFSFAVQFKVIGLPLVFSDDELIDTVTEIFIRGIIKEKD